MKLTLIRHGKTKGNLERRFAGGRTDESLCSEGIEQLNNLINDLSLEIPVHLFVSPMKRCIQTAQIFFPETKFNVIEEFRELDFGMFENHNHEELNGNELYQKWLDSKGAMKIPEGESLEAFGKRVWNGFCKMVEQCSFQDAAAVVHGGTIMSFVSKLTGKNFYEFMVKNGKGFELELSFSDSSFDSVKLVSLRKL